LIEWSLTLVKKIKREREKINQFYRYCSFVKLPNWVGIVPDSLWRFRNLFFRSFQKFVRLMEQKKKENKELIDEKLEYN